MNARVIAAMRSAVAPRGGAMSRLEPHELAAPVVRACLHGAELGVDDVDEVIVSNALGAGGNPARLVALASELPETVAGLSIDRQCAGGLDALLLARALVDSGQANVVIAGGVESCSRRPLRLRTDPDGGEPAPYDQPPFSPFPDRDPDMAEAAARLAERLGITKNRQDAWAIESHGKALAAQSRLGAEIVPIAGQGCDSFARNLHAGHCRRARPITGTVTAANTSVAADAAAFCVVVSERLAMQGNRPGVRIRAGVTLGAAPDSPGLSPVGAIGQALSIAGLSAGDLSVAEIMEAYAVQAIACVEAAKISPGIVNPGGGALARGHPIGASGAILAVRLYHELCRRGGIGLAAIAAAGGIGSALILSAD